MSIFFRIILGVMTMLITPMAFSDAAKTVFEAVYKGEYSGLNVTTTRSLTTDNNQHFTLNTKAKALFASINEVTVFSLHNDQIKPHSYQYARSVFGKKKHQSLLFNWDEMHVLGYKKNNQHTSTLPLAINTLDETTFQLQLQIDAAKIAVDETAKKNMLQYRFVKPFKHKDYTFFYRGLENFTYKNATTKAILLSTDAGNATSTQKTDKTIHVWLLPTYNYIIGKIEFIDENDDNYVLTLSDYTYNPDLIYLITPQ